MRTEDSCVTTRNGERRYLTRGTCGRAWADHTKCCLVMSTLRRSQQRETPRGSGGRGPACAWRGAQEPPSFSRATFTVAATICSQTRSKISSAVRARWASACAMCGARFGSGFVLGRRLVQGAADRVELKSLHHRRDRADRDAFLHSIAKVASSCEVPMPSGSRRSMTGTRSWVVAEGGAESAGIAQQPDLPRLLVALRNPHLLQRELRGADDDLFLVLEVVIERSAVHPESLGQAADAECVDALGVDDVQGGLQRRALGDQRNLRTCHAGVPLAFCPVSGDVIEQALHHRAVQFQA